MSDTIVVYDQDGSRLVFGCDGVRWAVACVGGYWMLDVESMADRLVVFVSDDRDRVVDASRRLRAALAHGHAEVDLSETRSSPCGDLPATSGAIRAVTVPGMKRNAVESPSRGSGGVP